MKASAAVKLVESAYRLDLPAEQWLAEVAKSAASAIDSTRAMAFRYDANERWINSGVPALHGFPPQFALDFFNQEHAPPEAVAGMASVFLNARFGTLRVLLERLNYPPIIEVLDRYGVEDMLGVNGLDPTGRGCMLAIATQRSIPQARTVHLWHRLAAHISAGNRLRATLEKLAIDADPTNHAEAILSENGKIEHATGPAEPKDAREALRDALVRIDAARSEKDDADRSLDLWQGLVSGRWSLVEHFERGGRRYFLAHKNDPELTADRTLTERERQVLGYAELGYSNKLIAYALGLSLSSISADLARARKKQGTSDR
jgi:DNA-binding CsgD family transcriptional regulator